MLASLFSTPLRRRTPFTACILYGLLTAVLLGASTASAQELFARMNTDAGTILLQLNAELAPRHVDNFVHLARTDFYKDTYFHRVIPGFMIQGGDPNTRDTNYGNDGMGGPTLADVLTPEQYQQVQKVNEILESRGYAGIADRANLKSEFSRTIKHARGTLSMARAQDPNSAGSQFFICDAPKSHLDGQYTIFGHVVSGMDVVDEIVNAPCRPGGNNLPVEPVHILEIEIITGEGNLTEIEREALAAGAAAAENVTE